jgi:ribosomal protein S8
MSLVNLAHVCSHLQNASKARLAVTSVPASNLVLRLMLGLHAAGFLSFVVRGGPEPPVFASPTSLVPEAAPAPTAASIIIAAAAASSSNTTTTTTSAASSAGSASAVGGATSAGSAWAGAAEPAEPADPAAVTQASIASRRLWLGLKYWHNEPVLRRMRLVSRPTRRTWMGAAHLELLVRGRKTGYVRGLTQPGECLFVTTDRGVMEARECVERRIGGMLLCRVL